jgi:hypothetical protein
MKKVYVTSLRFALGDCTNGGATAKHQMLTLFSADTATEEIEQYCDEFGTDKSKCLRVVVRENPRYGNFAEVVFKQSKNAGTYMAGGNFVYSSNSTYEEITGSSSPISVHDRFETWKQYEYLSK